MSTVLFDGHNAWSVELVPNGTSCVGTAVTLSSNGYLRRRLGSRIGAAKWRFLLPAK